MTTLSPAFKDRIIAVHGQIGQIWLESLPELQKEMIERWSLSEIQPIQDLSYNYLVFAETTENASVVLKLGVPDPEFLTEIQSLKAFNGKGTVRILEADPALGALLLERILPGETLLSIEDDQESTRIAAQLMKKFWMPAPPGLKFPTAADWCQGFQRYQDKYSDTGPISFDMINKASHLARELLQSSQKQVLLHGDLHHMNILSRENKDWVAIDPKGVIGEPAFEVGALLLNPVPDLIHWPDLNKVQKQRLMILSEELNIAQERLTAWSFVRAVLSAIWSVEDWEDCNYGVEIARVLRDLL